MGKKMFFGGTAEGRIAESIRPMRHRPHEADRDAECWVLEVPRTKYFKLARSTMILGLLHALPRRLMRGHTFRILGGELGLKPEL